MKVYVPKAVFEKLRDSKWSPTSHCPPIDLFIDQYSLCCCSDETSLQLEGLGDCLVEKELKDKKIKELEEERKELASKLDKVDKELSELSCDGPFSYRHCLPHGAEGKVDKEKHVEDAIRYAFPNVAEDKSDKEFKVGDKVYCEFYKNKGTVVSVDSEYTHNSVIYPVAVRLEHNDPQELGYYTKEGKFHINDEIALKKVTDTKSEESPKVEFKAGDKVWCGFNKVIGTVETVNHEHPSFPVRVSFGEDVFAYYTKDGRYHFNAEIVLKKI